MAISNNNTGIRTGVCTSTTRPTAPYEGQMIYETDTDLTYVWGGSAWQQVSGGTAVGNSGLVYVKSQTVGSSVANVSVASAFSATYDNYLIQYTGGTHSTQTELRIQLSGATGNDYTSAIVYLPYNGSVSGATTTTSAFGWCGSASANNSVLNTTLYSPFLAKNTFASTTMWEFPSGVGSSGGRHTLDTSYTGFVVVPAAGTLTGGTITVYGYRKA